MSQALIQLGLFTTEAIIIAMLILLVLVAFIMLLAKSKEKTRGKLCIKSLNQKYDETKETILAETLSKKQFKQFLKTSKEERKARAKEEHAVKNIFVLSFQGDMKASATSSLSEEINALLNIATPKDEIVLRLESAGGVVHGYGLAAAN